jgi:hypothetical protein
LKTNNVNVQKRNKETQSYERKINVGKMGRKVKVSRYTPWRSIGGRGGIAPNHS